MGCNAGAAHALQYSAAITILFALRPTGLLLAAAAAAGEEAAGGATPLFVFGDSYLDTGNHDLFESPWQRPYGNTWPGTPAGRFSDGHVLTDQVAKRMGGSPSPIPYRICNDQSNRQGIAKNGVNFAVGGSGVFEAFDARNLSIQVDRFISMQSEAAYSHDLPSLQTSTVLLSIGGNDLLHFLLVTGSIKDLPDLSKRVVQEIIRNLERLHSLGVRRFVLSNLGPIGCIPFQTASVFYGHCIQAMEDIATFHNTYFQQEIHEKLSALTDTNYVILDQFKAFSQVINQPHLFGFEEQLRPCCHSELVETLPVCGQIDKNGKALYEVCSNPEKHLFWDGVHPTEAGWDALATLMLGNGPMNDLLTTKLKA